MPPTDRGGSTSVRGRIHSPHSSGGLAQALRAQARLDQQTDRQTDRRTDGGIAYCLLRQGHKTGITILLLHSCNGLFSRTTWVSWYQKSKTSLDLNEVRDYGVLGCSGISWTICKQSSPRSRQITTPTPHHSIFTGRMLFLTPNQQCQSTEG